MDKPRILVISHNCFSKNTNVGKTLKSYFSRWDNSSLAELFFHSEIPNDDVCVNYFRITDKEALKSIVLRGCFGKVFTRNDILLDSSDTRIDSGGLRKIYEIGRRRKPFISLLRDIMWDLSSWHSKRFKKWLDSFNPSVIFLAAGDYAFPYKISLKISKSRNIPIVMCCFDDFFINYQHEGEFFRNCFHKHLMKWAKKLIDCSKATFAVSPKMSKDYELLFHRKWPVLFTPTSVLRDNNEFSLKDRRGISYLGNLSYGRFLQLIRIGRCLYEMNSDILPRSIDVYSFETNKSILNSLSSEKGIAFHGPVEQNKVQSIISSSLAVLHVESFDSPHKEIVMYSLSTKIADCLGSGTPIIAFGPKQVASIDYLLENKCAFYASDENQLKHVFNDLMNESICRTVVDNALKLAGQNHSINSINKTITDCFESVVKGNIYVEK